MNNLDNIKEELKSIQNKGYKLVRTGNQIVIVDPNNIGDIDFGMYTQLSPGCKVTFPQVDDHVPEDVAADIRSDSKLY